MGSLRKYRAIAVDDIALAMIFPCGLGGAREWMVTY